MQKIEKLLNVLTPTKQSSSHRSAYNNSNLNHLMCESQELRPDNLIIVDTAEGLFYKFQVPKTSNEFYLIADSFVKQSLKPEFFFEVENKDSSGCFMRPITSYEDFLTCSQEFNPQGVLIFLKTSPLPISSNPKPWRCRTCGRRDISSSSAVCPLCASPKIP